MRAGCLDCREVIVSVLKELPLNVCFLVHEVMWVVFQKDIYFILCLTPISICKRVLAVRKSDNRISIITIEPIVLDCYVFAIEETDWLVVKLLKMLINKTILEVLPALLEAIFVVKQIAAAGVLCQLISDELDIRIVK